MTPPGVVVVDVNVGISAFLSPRSTAASMLLRLVEQGITIAATPLLLEELTRTLASKKFRRYTAGNQAHEFITRIEQTVQIVPDIDNPPVANRDPNDDYLIAIAAAQQAVLITGDKDLLEADTTVTVRTPRDYLADIQSA